MRLVRQDWVRLPTAWIQAGGLKTFRWGGDGGTAVAALLTLVVIAHHADQDSGVARLTYDQLQQAAGLSRTKVSDGLKRLVAEGVIARPAGLGQSAFQLTAFDRHKPGWGKLPYRRLYDGRRVMAFQEFRLRSATELNALKIYLLFVARRNIETNFINLSYEHIAGYTGIDPSRIKSALSLLATLGLVHTDQVRSTVRAGGIANAYRVVHIDPYTHMGTAGRAMEGLDFNDL